MLSANIKPASVRKLADGAYAYMQDAQGGWGFNNTALVTSRGQTLLIDTTSDIPMNRKMLAAFATAEPTPQKIDVLFLTHWHVDHVHGACMEEFKNSRVIASEACADWMADLPPKAWIATVESLTGDARKQMDENLGHGDYFDFSGLSPITPTEVFNGSMKFKVGDEDVEVFEGKPSHTRSDSLVRVPGKGIVHTGDITTGGNIQGLNYPGMQNLIQSLELLIRWDAKTYVPGHGPLLTKSDVQHRLDHCRWLFHEVKRRYDKGMRFEHAADDLLKNLGPYKNLKGHTGLYWTVKMIYAELEGHDWDHTRRNYPKYLAKCWELKHEVPKKLAAIGNGAF